MKVTQICNSLLIVVFLSGCDYIPQPQKNTNEPNRVYVPDTDVTPRKDAPVRDGPVITGMQFEPFGRMEATDPDGDELVYSIISQDVPDMFGITSDGYLHILNPMLIQRGVFKALIRAQEYDTPEQFYVDATATISVFMDGGLPVGCDTVVMQIDSVFIPGYWQKDTTFLYIRPECWDTIPIR